MTPEERAKAVDHSCQHTHLPDDALTYGCVACFAAAIRAAENEALERAALCADQHGTEILANAGSTAEWDATDTIAEVIRSLKHPVAA